MDLSGSVAIVTGATRGMGRAISGRLAAAGARVALVARTQAALDTTEADIRASGGEVAGFVTDVSDRGSVETMVDAVMARFGRIDVLVNCAFWGPPGSLEQTDEAFWDRTLDTSLKGPYLCTRAVYPTMRAQGKGAIVNIGSLAGKIGEDDRTAYCAAKWGLEGLTAALRVELHKHDIRVHLISPGATDTSFWSHNAPGLTPDQLARFIPPDMVADAVLWVLGTPDAVHIPDVAIHNYRDPFEGKGSPFES
ncbi:MAG TPA: SDR family oxidoreductase [Candidatus Limnocylindrales bacterium]|nr:SDR family oxidoreductase [Candidatus Limnocylindrales bacterium]